MFFREKNIDANVFDNTLQHRKTLVKQCTKFLSSSSGNLVIGISETLALLLCSFHLFTATSLGHNPQSTIQPFPPASLITMKFHQDVNRTSSQDCCCGRTWCSLQSFLLAFSCDSLQTRPRWSETWFLWQMVLLKIGAIRIYAFREYLCMTLGNCCRWDIDKLQQSSLINQSSQDALEVILVTHCTIG